MAPKRTGLGRGIGALIPTANEQQTVPSTCSSRPADRRRLGSVAGPGRPRRIWWPCPARGWRTSTRSMSCRRCAAAAQGSSRRGLQELVHSIREIGRPAAIVVRPIPAQRARTRSTSHHGRAPDCVPRRSFRALDDPRDRQGPPPMTRCSATRCSRTCTAPSSTRRGGEGPYQQLLADFGITQEQLAQRIGRSRPQITNTIRLLRLPSRLQRRVCRRSAFGGTRRAIPRSADAEAMEYLAERR